MINKREAFPGLFAALAAGALTLTVNKRLARSLRGEYDAWMGESGRSAWRTPNILSLDGWMHRVLRELDEDAGLLTQQGALWLWEQVIEGDVVGSELALLQVAATARRALEAHQLLVEYGGTLSGQSLSEDHRAFLRWRQGYREACRQGGWFDLSELPFRLCTAIETGRYPLPEQIFLVGFDELTPAVRQLSTAMGTAGAEVIELVAAANLGSPPLRLPCLDSEDEVRRAARWARQLLESGVERIGVVVADLQQRRALVERVFREEIDPEAVATLDEKEDRFSLSLGSCLEEQGVVTAALEILGVGSRLNLDTLSFLLRTPYLAGSQQESQGRARFDRHMRSKRQTAFNLSRLLPLLDAHRDELQQPVLPETKRIFAALAAGLKDTRRRKLGEWVSRFSEQLQEVGWPGERPLGSQEFQVLKAWKENLLPALVALEAVSGPLERAEALGLLRRLAKETSFQVESPATALQVVGLLEASGLQFDQLWVLGMTDDQLPTPARPNPFIPGALQIARNMPHASAERELAFARQVVTRLAAAAPKVIFSHPLKDGDLELRPSPLIAYLEAGHLHDCASQAPQVVMRQHPSVIEALNDEQGPALDAARASGGTGLLKDQALCPFRAFAHHRLGARAFELSEPGLDAATRGSLLHAVLERFWQATENHAQLLGLSPEQLVSRIAQAADEALAADVGDAAGTPLYRIERERLCALVGEWLEEVEKPRASFVVVAAEVEKSVACGAVTIDTKVDRIDQLADGRRVIIDYKTGRFDVADLLGERLLEPQLPVYACEESTADLAAVIIAAVRGGECAAKGVAAEAELLPKLAAFAGSRPAEKSGIADWPALLARWQRQLAELGDEFARGDAAVDPVEIKKACEYCDLAGLCRVDENISRVEESE